MKYIYGMVAVILGAMIASTASAQVNQETAYDERDNVVTNTFGNCVRTKWDSEGDVCAPPPPPKPVAAPPPPPPPAPKISREHRTIYFDFNKSKLNEESVAKLDNLVALIGRSPAIVGAGIAGYADRIGSDDYNLELSKKRAKTVYEYLSERVTINTQILDIRAFGENNPKTDCSEKLKRSEKIACLANDRRVEVIFEYKE